MQRLFIATRNPGKLRELEAILGHLQVALEPALTMPEVAETGTTFSENAELKAREAAAWGGDWALADDSGLEVDALGGGPGVHSNRFAGESTTEEDRNEALLRLMDGVPDGHRTARYRAAVALAAPDGRVWITEGTCEGVILREGRGSGGFGYDPLFFLPEYGCTMAELPPEEKNRISHRARALAEALPIIEKLARAASCGGPG